MPNLDPVQLALLQQSFKNASGQPGMVNSYQNLANALDGDQQPPQQDPALQQQMLARQLALKQMLGQK